MNRENKDLRYIECMQLKMTSPTKVYLEMAEPSEVDSLRQQLKYVNTANQHLLKRHYNSLWFKRNNEEGWNQRLEELKASVNKNLLCTESDGRYYFRPGSLPYLTLRNEELTNLVTYPEPKVMAWAKPLPFNLHGYQEESWQKLLEAKHANVQICTGAGKSAIILKLCRQTGFKTAIIAPSKAIFKELLEKFEHHFGRSNVGAFGDGKKKLGKRFTICIGDSVVNIKRDTEEWQFFSTLEMICVDESHTWGADTLEDICHGVLSEVPYRMFFSATQTRGDGAEKLLQSIIGKTVHTLTTAEAVAGGFICPHDFTIVELESSNSYYQTSEALDMKRAHLLKNKNIAAFIAKLANLSASLYKKQTLVLVEELSQIAMLVPMLQVPFAYAHSESKSDRLAELGLTKVDPSESVEKFNKGEAMVLIGTSCIATGTNIFPTHNTCNWVGGASEIKTKQGPVGRSVRNSSANPWASKVTPKEIAKIWDFDVFDIPVMVRHLEARIGYYKESNAEIRRIKFKKVQ